MYTISETFVSQVFPEFNLFENKLYPVVVAYSDETTYIKPEDLSSFFTLRFQKVTFESAGENTNLTDTKKIEYFDTVKCKDLEGGAARHFDYLNEKKADSIAYIETYGTCVSIPDNVTIKGKNTDNLVSFFTIQMLPCSKSTGCKTAADLSKVNFAILIPYTNYNYSNVDNPLTFGFTADIYYYIHPGMKQIYLNSLKQIQVKDSLGFLNSKDRVLVAGVGSKTSTFQYRKDVTACTAAQAAIPDNPDCMPYFEFTLMSSGRIDIHRRTYPRITDTLGAIGGTSNVLFIS